MKRAWIPMQRGVSQGGQDYEPSMLLPDDPGMATPDYANFQRELSRAERIWAERMKSCQRH
jgi:hypothetical protein